MGFLGFGKRDPLAPRRQSHLKLDLTTLLILTIMTLVVMQAFGLMFGDALGLDVKLGPIFILLAVSMASATSIAIFKKLVSDTEVTKKDIFAIIVTALLAVLVLFFLRDLVPEIFQQSILQLQSIIGI